jgi:hypothetical protein
MRKGEVMQPWWVTRRKADQLEADPA